MHLHADATIAQDTDGERAYGGVVGGGGGGGAAAWRVVGEGAVAHGRCARGEAVGVVEDRGDAKLAEVRDRVRMIVRCWPDVKVGDGGLRRDGSTVDRIPRRRLRQR